MANSITEILNNLTNAELNEAYENINELQTKGELGPENVFRRLHAQIREIVSNYSMHALERDILFLIAKRAYPLPTETV